MDTTVDPAPLREIQLDLRRHCIETEIKKQYDLAIGAYFKLGADKTVLEARIELLELAMGAFDFPALRSRYPELCGGSSPEVLLFYGPQGKPQLQVGADRVEAAISNAPSAAAGRAAAPRRQGTGRLKSGRSPGSCR